MSLIWGGPAQPKPRLEVWLDMLSEWLFGWMFRP